MSVRRGRIFAALIILAGCGTGQLSSGGPSDDLVEINTTVLENAYQGPELCLGGMTASLPPSCGGLPITNWDWMEAQDEERVGGVIWGRYHLVGRFDGTSFTLAEKPGPVEPVPHDAGYDFSTPCQEPSGGWDRPDPGKVAIEDYDAAIAVAAKQPDYSVAWIDAPVSGPPGEPVQDITVGVINAAFTGNPDAHEAELRKVWGGALCLYEHERSSAERERIFEEAVAFIEQELGLRSLGGSATKGIQDLIEIEVVFADEEDRAAIDARFGEGAVVLISALKPVS